MTDTRRPAVDWVDDRIEIIDQTRLPTDYDVLVLDSTDKVIDAIERLAVRGAPAIGVCGAYGVVVGLDEAAPSNADAARAIIAELAHSIGTARPTAVNLAYAVDRVTAAALQADTVDDMRAAALAEARAVHLEDVQSTLAIGRNGADELSDRHRIMTHCNTGRLATSGMGTALGVIYTKVDDGHPVKVYACETRPLLQGSRLTAWELLDAGVDTTLLVDGAGAALLGTGAIDAVIVGADRIAANGDTANKIGTRSHAIAAGRERVPFYVAAPLSTFDISIDSGDEIDIELRSDDEVRRFRDAQSAPPEVPSWNAAFDVTPNDLITGIITEVGVLRPPFRQSIAAAFDRVGAPI